MPIFPTPIPELPVTDLTAALHYYQHHLGFTHDWGTENLAGISRGHCRLFLANLSFRQLHGNNAPILIWLNLDSKAAVDDLYTSWTATNARLLSAPESKTWGLHEFTAADLDDNLFRIFYDFATPSHKARTTTQNPSSAPHLT